MSKTRVCSKPKGHRPGGCIPSPPPARLDELERAAKSWRVTSGESRACLFSDLQDLIEQWLDMGDRDPSDRYRKEARSCAKAARAAIRLLRAAEKAGGA